MLQRARALATSVPVIEGVTASRLQLPPGRFETLLDGLCARFPAIDRSQWRRRMAQGRVLDEQCRPLAMDAPYAAGRTVFYFREVEDEAPIPFDAQVLYVDHDMVVADKPHFLPVAPTGVYVRQTLLSRLVRQLDNPELVPLHR
ncbi:MAG TPA: pseudouridine synthase, partial [Pseudoxanthomonas sp.]|nr:pseudouridine synthase [Pseudoxanthomonas sp.]